MTNTGTASAHPESSPTITGLIGYTIHGIPYPLSENEEVHKSIAEATNSRGERAVKLYYAKDKEAFKKVVADYARKNQPTSNTANLERWDLEGDSTPLPAPKNARLAPGAGKANTSEH